MGKEREAEGGRGREYVKIHNPTEAFSSLHTALPPPAGSSRDRLTDGQAYDARARARARAREQTSEIERESERAR